MRQEWDEGRVTMDGKSDAVIDRQVILRYQVMQPMICGSETLISGGNCDGLGPR
jgi:hypothetical protein